MHCVATGESEFRAYERSNSEIVLKEKFYGKGFCFMASRHSVWINRYTLAVWFSELASSH